MDTEDQTLEEKVAQWAIEIAAWEEAEAARRQREQEQEAFNATLTAADFGWSEKFMAEFDAMIEQRHRCYRGECDHHGCCDEGECLRCDTFREFSRIPENSPENT